MHSASVVTFFSLIAAALAISITSPTNGTGWTTTGPNVVSWNRVDTDPASFAIVLNNQVCSFDLQLLLPVVTTNARFSEPLPPYHRDSCCSCRCH